MFAPTLINLLRTFSPGETKNFEKFLLSPFFNTSNTYIKFYRELIRFYPDFKNEKLTSEYIFRRMFAGKQFHKQTIWNLSSGLEKLAEEYLLHSAVRKDSGISLSLILNEFSTRILDRHFVKKLKEWEKLSANYKIDYNDLFNLAKLEEYKIIYWQRLKSNYGKQIEGFLEEAQIFILFFLVNIASDVDSLDTSRTFRGLNKGSSFPEEFVRSINFEKIIEFSKKSKYKYAALIEFFYNVMYCTLDKSNDRYYINARDFFFKNHDVFSFLKKKDLLSGFTNYCLVKILSGDSYFENELFKLNKFRLKYNIDAAVNGMINKSLYNQIIGNASTVKEFKWAEKFIEKYTPLLPAEYQDSMRKLAWAYIYFYTKNYNEVLDSLKKFKSADENDKLPVRNLIARTYYELKEFEILFYHIDSVKHFLKKSKNISEFRKEVNGKFYSYLNSIVTAIEKNDFNKLILIEEEIGRNYAVNNKAWLLEKIAEARPNL